MVGLSGNLSWRVRLMIIAGLAAVITVSAVIIAVAGSDSANTFTGQTPADGSKITVDKPAVLVNLYNGGTLDLNTAVMKIDGAQVAAQLSGTAPNYTLSYTPVQALADGEHTVTVAVSDSVNGLIQTSWKFTVGIGPSLGNFAPAPGSSAAATAPVISFIAEDRDGINSSSVQVKVSGKAVPASVIYAETGYWTQEWDSCSGYYYDVWVRTGYDYTKATVNATVSNVPDNCNVWVSAADQKGNASTMEWTFNAPVPPVISGFTPANNTPVNKPQPVISAKVTDNGAIDTRSIVLKINSNAVTPAFDASTGVVSYTPATPLTEGTYNVYLEVKDTFGNIKTATWVFRVEFDTTGPVLSNFAPAAGASVSTTSPAISLTATDINRINSSSVQVKVGGVNLPVRIVYPTTGRYEQHQDTCTGQWYDVWVVDGYDYTKATISATANNVPDLSNVQVQVGDQLGNVSTAEWSFKAMAPPVISDLTPANGTFAKTNLPTISAKITDYGPIDFNSIVMKLNNTVVKHTYTASGNSACVVSYSCTEPLAPGTSNVYLEVKDMAGNMKTASWAFSIRAGTAAFTAPEPASGTVVNVGNPDVRVKITDVANIDKNTLSVLVNGKPVASTIAFVPLGHYEQQPDSCTGELINVWVTDGYDYTQGNVFARTPMLPDGTSTVAVSITNVAGGTASYSWSFDVKVPPQLSQPTPGDRVSIVNTQPAISAKVTENGTVTGTRMLINGTEVPATYDPASGLLSYTPPTPLSINDDYNVQVAVYDAGGSSSTLSWRFHVQGYPDMQFSGKCTDCHIGYPEPNHPMANCNGCHGGGQPISDCADCHGGGIHPASWISGVGCEYCHSATYSYKIPVHPANNDGFHNTTTVMDSCQTCHKKSLTLEHGQRTDDAGSKLSCNTCHASSNALVQKAITNRQKNCDACHGTAGHETVHAVSILDANCTTCHINSLTGEHLSNAATQTDSTTGKLKPWNCDTCHSNSDVDISGSVTTGNKQCASCHSRAHNIGLSESVMADIPLYTGFTWTTPMNARLWAGESWMPQEFVNGGKVVVSNHRADVTGSDVYKFYADRLTANGWSADAPPISETNFAVTFTKGIHKAVIRYGGGDTPATGSRIEIIYR